MAHNHFPKDSRMGDTRCHSPAVDTDWTFENGSRAQRRRLARELQRQNNRSNSFRKPRRVRK